MARRRIVAALAVKVDDNTDAGEPRDQMPLPTLDERVNLYLRAVYGDRRFTNEESSGARALMLRAMSDDIVARSTGRSPDDVSLPLGAQHNGMTAFADPSLLGASDEPRSARDSQTDSQTDSQEAAPIVAQKPRAASLRWPQRWTLPAFPAGLFSRQMAMVCGAAIVAAVAGYWAAAITAQFAPPHDSRLAVQVSPSGPSSGSPSGSRIMAEAERELASAFNSAQLRPDEITALVKNGQELVAEGKFRFARLVLERAVEAKSATAALALARTYDPLVDRSVVRGDAPPDLAMARAWYEKAKDFGSTEAAQRLSQLPASVPATRPK